MAPRPLILAVLAAVVPPRPSPAPALQLEHDGVSCVLAERNPVLRARAQPSERLGRAKVYFHPEGVQHWYAVALQVEGADLVARLPRPKKTLAHFTYYIEVTDRDLKVTRTRDFTAAVVGDAGACGDDKVAGTAAAAGTIALEAPAGAPLVPPGFGAAGILGAGGGHLATALVVGGVVVGGGGAAALLLGGDDARPLAPVDCRSSADCRSVGPYSGCFASAPGGVCVNCVGPDLQPTGPCPAGTTCRADGVFGAYACLHACGSDGECNPGLRCDAGVCRWRTCAASKDCPSAYNCNPAEGRCERVPCSGGCPAGTTCGGAFCVEP